MGKRVISSEEFIDRFVECLEKGKEFRLENCIVEGDVNILDIYEKIKEKIKDWVKLKELITEEVIELIDTKKITINVNISIQILNVEFKDNFKLHASDDSKTLRITFNEIVCFIAEFNFADFTYSTFTKLVAFGGSRFREKAKFYGTVFNDVIFIGTFFLQELVFHNSVFNGKAYFDNSIFDIVKFYNSIFNEKVSFNDVVVNILKFHNSTFKSRADFRDIYFNILSFEYCIFEDLALFKKKEKIDEINETIKYEGLALFINTQFLNKHTKIENFPLSKTSFLKTDVREVMILCDIKKEEILSHKLLKLKENDKGIYKEAYEILKNDLDYKSVLAEYRNLRISIENNRTYIEASNLYTMEMELIKEYSNNWFERSIIKAYKEISDYGESIEKTGKWIFCSIIVFTILASILRFKGMEWDIIEIIKFWFVSFLEVIRLFLQIGTDDKSLWILEPIVRVTSLILLGNLYIAIRRKLSRK
jgi:uncharacterized protein YjbI with pentapeptide repeats